MPNFKFNVAESQQEKNQILESIYRLRYQVYVTEWGFEDPDDHPDGLEMDSHDLRSLHFYAYTGSIDRIIGTARIILGSELKFPIEQHFKVNGLPLHTPRNKIAEISRLAISKEFRRRAIDQVIFSRHEHNAAALEKHQEQMKKIERERRKCEHELIRGIYLLVYRQSLKLGITHWYAVMAKGLYLILCRWGIRFEQIGPAREYHGFRAPYLLAIRELETNLEEKNPELLALAREENPGS